MSATAAERDAMRRALDLALNGPRGLNPQVGAVILSPDPILQPSSFDGQRFGLTPRGTGPVPYQSRPGLLAEGLAGAAVAPAGAIVLTSLDVGDAESRLIQRALEVSGGNRTRAAQLLGMSVRTLRNKLNGPGRIEVA